MIPERYTGHIVAQKPVAAGYWDIQVALDEEFPIAQAGQFFTLLPEGYPMPLLRRPFAYSSCSSKKFSFIYAVRGTATKNISMLQEGSIVDCLGPLGTGFPEPPASCRPILISGGIGIGPIAFFADALAKTNRNPLVLVGARRAELLPQLQWHAGIEVRFCTDDGSFGIHGTVLDALDESEVFDGAFFSCGPAPMMLAVHRRAEKSHRPSWVSVEEIMACGVGACQGCAVEMQDSRGPAYQRACVEGPVFNSSDIVWANSI